MLILSAFIAALLLSVFLGSCENALMEAVERDIAGLAAYTVTYKANGATGGEVPVDLTEYKTGETVTVLDEGTLEKDEYDFVHWNTQDDDNGTSYVAGPTLIMGTSDVTLWAIWTQLPTYTVTFDSKGGSAVDSQLVIEGDFVLEPGDPTRSGYTFAGWFQESACNNPWDFASDTVTANRTLYADWDARTYTVTFDARGGTTPSPANIIVTYDEAYGTLATTSRSYYVFDGWWTGVNGTGSQVSGSEVTGLTTVATASNHTLYAKWGWPDYSIGDTAPSDGYIVYINPDAETDGWKYLEAYRRSHPMKSWGTLSNSVNGADGTALGTGEQNTSDIVTGDPASDKAADYCNDLSSENPIPGRFYEDWFLPSREELELVYTHLQSRIGIFYVATTYWSSSEYNSSNAWVCDFSDGSTSYAAKNNTYYVLPFRKY